MSTFLNGGGTLKATNSCQALLELFWLVDEAEKQLQDMMGLPRKTSWTADLGNQVVSFTATNLPMLDVINSAGRPEMVQQNYFGTPLGDFDPGTGGDLFSVDLPSALVEQASRVSTKESEIPQTVATQKPHTTNLTYNMDAKTVTITSTLPISTEQDPTTGAITITAIDFLP